MNYTQTTPNYSKPKAFKNPKLPFSQTLYSSHNFGTNEGVHQSHKTPPYILTKRKLIKKLSKTYPSQGSPNNQKEQNHKETKSHGSPCDSIINHNKTTSHGSPCGSTINHNKTTSHGSPCGSTINHNKTTSHGSPCDSIINHNKTTSHGSPCDSTINYNKTTSHGAHDISLCTMTHYRILYPI